MKKLIFILCVFLFSFFSCHFSFSQTWQYYDSLRTIYQQKQSYDTALVYAEKALQAANEMTGENDTLYANMLTALFEVNYYSGNYKNALEYCEKEKEIRKTIQGEKHPDYANSLNNLAMLYYEMGNYPAVEPLFLEAKNIVKEVLGKKHHDYAESLNNLAALYWAMGNYPAAEPLYLEAINIKKEVLGENHPDYANSLNNLANLYYAMGNYPAAEPLYLEAMNIRKEALGEKHPDYASSLNNLAILYDYMGNYPAAELLYLEAKNINKEVLGEKHPEYARSLNNLAALYFEMGNYPAAEPLLLEAKNIRKEVLGEKHPDYATSLNNLATLYHAMGNYPAAEPLLLEANNIWKEVLGEKHPDYATSLNNLAKLYQTMDNFLAAEPLFIEAKNIRKEVLGEKHPDYALSLNNLAGLYRAMGNYPAAEPLFLEAKNIRKEVLGEKHPDYAGSLNNLAGLYKAMGNYPAAGPLYLECLEIINSNIALNFTFLSEKEKEMYFKTQAGTFAGFYSFSLKRKTDDKEITKTVFNNVVKNKGLLLKSSTAMRTAILNSKDTALISQYEKWIALKKEISKLYSTEISKRKNNPEELEQQANAIEKDLVKGSQVFSDFEKLQSLNWESVKKSLKPGEAAIEFIHFRNSGSNSGSSSGSGSGSNSSSRDTVLYCALIIKPESQQPEMIRLFEEQEIKTIIGISDLNNFKYVNGVYGTNENTNEALYKLIWQPLEPYLKDVKTVYYSPDGILHKVSFAALGKRKNIYLCDNYNIQQVSSTGKVAMPENTIWDEELTAGLFGGIEYSTDTTTEKIWNYLPGTKTETDKIAEIFKKKKIVTTYLSGRTATEDTIKSIASNCNILHISTHGFFYPEPEQLVKEEKTEEKADSGLVAFRGGNTGFGLWQFTKNKNPLMRSGLAMARANNVWNQRFVGEGEDGVLTAQEVTQLDLSETNLVVLSACETGLGDIKGSEGVYGLQRAFKMAGVKYIIMSLWQVPDKETVEFMEMFYKKLLKEKDVRLAFNETQKEMRKKYDPYYWGAFVLVE